MNKALSDKELQDQSGRYRGTGGTSEEARVRGFLPAFLDLQTGIVYLSRLLDGRLVAIHVLDGLPDELVVSRCENGRVLAVKQSLIAGFSFDGCFYTRDEAAALATRKAS
jgi:hypothetical protein